MDYIWRSSYLGELLDCPPHLNLTLLFGGGGDLVLSLELHL